MAVLMEKIRLSHMRTGQNTRLHMHIGRHESEHLEPVVAKDTHEMAGKGAHDSTAGTDQRSMPWLCYEIRDRSHGDPTCNTGPLRVEDVELQVATEDCRCRQPCY